MEPTAAPTGPTGRVVCRAAKDPQVRKFIIGGGLIAMALWCFSDPQPVPASWSDINAASSYIVNNIFPYFLLPLGVAVIIWGALLLRRQLIADEEGIGYAGKTKTPWAQVAQLDARQIKKGFLYLQLPDGERMVLDSWKLQNFRELVAFVETHIPAERQVV